MEPLTLIAGMALLLAFAFFVGYPFFASSQQGRTGGTGLRGRQLQEHKEQLFASIKELEFDQELGKISDGDYQRLRSQLEGEALAVIQQLDELNGQAGGDALRARIEDEVRARRETPDAGQKVETETPAAFCTSCGAKRREQDLFCSQCGTRFAGHEN